MLRIKAERLKRGWRQEDLGFYARMAGADVSRIETGRGSSHIRRRLLGWPRPLASSQRNSSKRWGCMQEPKLLNPTDHRLIAVLAKMALRVLENAPDALTSAVRGSQGSIEDPTSGPRRKYQQNVDMATSRVGCSPGAGLCHG
jgi:hypothetical protein